MGSEDAARPDGSTQPDGLARLDAVISGWVQGVGFRVYAAQRAIALDLTGWVRNEDGGRVHLVAEGRRPALETLLAALEEGPPGSQVSGVSAAWSAATGSFQQFEIRSGSTSGD